MTKETYSLGVVSVSFRKHTPLEILKQMKTAGLNFIEWGSDVHAPPRDIENLKTIASMQKEYGVATSSYGTYFRLGVTPVEELADYIRAAEILGTNVLRLWCGDKCGKDMTDAERSFLLSECKKAAAIAEKENVILCMECHRWSFTEEPEDAAWLMENVASRNFRMYWQPPHWKTREEALESARKIMPYALNIHVFNLQMQGETPAQKPLADAISDWRSFLEYFPAPRALLLEFMPHGTLDELVEEASSLREIAT